MSGTPPRVYLFHGEDEFSLRQAVLALEERLGAQDPAGLDRARLDGRTSGMDEIVNAVAVMPFFTERRLVILTNPLAKLTTEAARERFTSLLDQAPQTTGLVLVVDRSLDKKHWLMRWVLSAGKSAYEKNYRVQRGAGMANWIRAQAERHGGSFSYAAAGELGNLVGEDTRLADQEIQKLLAYVNFARPVEPEDVQIAGVGSGQADIFAMVDALGQLDARTAMRQLGRILETQEAPLVFGMIVRQFRLLLQTRELIDNGVSDGEIAKQTGMHPFVAGKVIAQSRNFSLPVLEQLYRKLADIDEGFKTGEIVLDVALYTLPATLRR